MTRSDVRQPQTDELQDRAPSPLAVFLQVLATVGYGLWMLLGLALALGIYSDGRGEVLVPLMVGGIFLSVGLALACLRLPAAPSWHGWTPGRSYWPGREALIALLCYLPMLAVAGLARGDNDFWATRLSGAALMLCSLACLVYLGPWPDRALALTGRAAAQLPAGRVVAALYGGGLWLWLCVAGQGEADRIGDLHPWILALLVIALILGLSEGARWQLLERNDPTQAGVGLQGYPVGAARPLNITRMAAAALSFGVPCLALLWAELVRDGVSLAAVAGLCYLAGRCLEQRLYGRALLRLHRRQAEEFR